MRCRAAAARPFADPRDSLMRTVIAQTSLKRPGGSCILIFAFELVGSSRSLVSKLASGSVGDSRCVAGTSSSRSGYHCVTQTTIWKVGMCYIT